MKNIKNFTFMSCIMMGMLIYSTTVSTTGTAVTGSTIVNQTAFNYTATPYRQAACSRTSLTPLTLHINANQTVTLNDHPSFDIQFLGARPTGYTAPGCVTLASNTRYNMSADADKKIILTQA